jgi:putative Mg2+ transporter-C (MgtC) family protein
MTIGFEGVALRLIAAAILGGIVGFERESRHAAAGLRTLILVAVGAALLTILALQTADTGQNPAVLTAGVVSGIGFLGAGAILRDKNNVHGTTTAASIWVVAMTGMAVGYGYFTEAIMATVVVLAVLVGLYYYETKYLRKPKKI